MASVGFIVALAIIAVPLVVAGYDVAKVQVAEFFMEAAEFPDTPIEGVAESCEDCRSMTEAQREAAIQKAIAAAASNEQFRNQTDSLFGVFGDNSGSVRNFFLSMPQGALEMTGNQGLAEKYYKDIATPMICHGIAKKSADIINQSNIPGIKRASVVTKDVGIDHHWRTKVEYTDGSVALIDWHEPLDTDEPNVYTQDDDISGWQEDDSF